MGLGYSTIRLQRTSKTTRCGIKHTPCGAQDRVLLCGEHGQSQFITGAIVRAGTNGYVTLNEKT